MSKPIVQTLAVLIAALITLQAAKVARADAFVVMAQGNVVIMDYELHLQEGFDGETLVVTVDTVEVARITARTRMQIGLAHIEKLTLKAGQTLTFRLLETTTQTRHLVAADTPFIQISLEDGVLHVSSTKTLPGYL